MKRLTIVALFLLLAGCSAAPYSYSPTTTNDPAAHGGGPGPGNVPANPSATGGGS